MENLQEAEQLLSESETVAEAQPMTLERIMAELRDALLYLFNLISLFVAPLSALSDLYSQVDYGAYPAAKDDALRARDYYLQIYRSL